MAVVRPTPNCWTASLRVRPARMPSNCWYARRFHHDPANSAAIQDAVLQAESELKQNGRVVLRASGTEAVIRVMVEGANEQQVLTLAKRLASVVAEAAA